MIRRHKFGTARKRIVLRNQKGRRPREYRVEQLESRYMLTATPANAVSLGAPMLPDYSQLPASSSSLASGALLQTAPFPFEQTFHLSSLPGATKTIYLDFVGFTARNTIWNTAVGLPNIVTPNFSLDDDVLTFSEDELTMIQGIWERVTEDFRPFNVNVTTQDPGVEALRNTSDTDPTDNQWGIRLVIGGSVQDWWAPIMGSTNPGRAYLGSFSWDSDTPAYIWSNEFNDPMADAAAIEKNIAEAVSHETGHTLGLAHDGQTRFYKDVTDPDKPKVGSLDIEYYKGHGFGPTSWAPIMGAGYYSELTQWSKGEYWGATNIEDDLAIITSVQNGFGYRTDDHGDSIATADPLSADPLTADLEVSTYVGEGNIERNTDIDYFSFQVEGLGELVSFDIEPFYKGPNLDVAAKVYDSTGTVIVTGDSMDEINAIIADQPLQPGTYYLSIQGGSRPITFIDPAVHPGPPEITKENPDDPVTEDLLPVDTSDWGYTNYGSLGYYSITATRKKALVVGVDFDAASGPSPTNWNRYTGGSSPATLTNLVSEAGLLVPYKLTVTSSGTNIDTVASTAPITSNNVPAHGIPLDKIGGYIATSTDTLTFQWSNLAPGTVYQIYVFGHGDTAVKNHVTVVGGQWNGVQQVYDFTQDVAAHGLVVGDNAPGHNDLSTYSLLVISDLEGHITITVDAPAGSSTGIAGLAISTTKVGSISGIKWNDANGNSTQDSGEAPLANWRIYLDLNNDGVLNSTAGQSVVAQAPNVPQPLQDYATVKNELVFPYVGSVSDINVTLDINHTYDADLNVWLVSPAGTRVKLFGDLGGAGDNFHNTVLDDEALIALASGSAPFTGTFRPQQALSTFDGENAAGVWKLEVQDDATGDIGVLNNWSISVDLAGVYLEPTVLTDAAGKYNFADLPAGQYFVRESFSAAQTAGGWKQTHAPTPVTVRSGANVQGIDFGNWIPVAQHGSISGLAFNDLDSDGVHDAGEAGLPGWIVYIDANNNGVRDTATTPTTISATGLPKPITDFSTVNSQVSYAGLGTVFNIQVTLDITHSFVGDLDAYLISPSGRQVELFTAVGGQYNNLTNVTLDDTAARSIASLTVDDVPYTGTFRPEGLLSDFNGEDANGTWTLQIRDTAFADQGTLNSWSLKITAGEIFRTTDADGNYSFSDLPAGAYIVREDPQSGWTQVPPATTTIPAATWAGSQWNVTVVGVDNPSDPNGPDSQRNVKNVNFGSHQAQASPGDFDNSHVVDASDYIMWRKKLGTTASPPFSGADGNGNGVVDAADYDVWRAHFGQTFGAGSALGSVVASGSALAAADMSPDWSQEASVSVSSPVAASTSSAAFASDTSLATTTSASVGRSAARPVYRPSNVSATPSDDALLAWLSDSTGAVASDEAGDLLVQSDIRDNVECVDNAFGELETALASSGSVL